MDRSGVRFGSARAADLLRTLTGFALFLLSITAAQAQAYPQIHVSALSQRADRSSVAPNDIFHVTIHAKIAQRRERLDELILGSFQNCEIISNETVRTSAPDGTDFVERLTLQALAPGDATISPAYIDALDPSLGRPMRFSSNALRVHVTGGAPTDFGLRGVVDVARRLALAVALAVGLTAAIFVLAVIFVRRRKRRPRPAASVPVIAPPVAETPRPPNERLLRAMEFYGSMRSDAALADLRGVLFERAGVGRGATLVDALGKLGESQPGLRPALLAAERAMFGPAFEREAGGTELLAATQAYTASGAPNEGAWTR